MGSVGNPSKPHYDITMSKRTRKGQSKAAFKETVCALKENNKDKKVEHQNEEEKRKKQFIEDENECRSSLGEHFTEEDKQLQLVVKPRKEGTDGVSLKKMVSRCTKMWSHLIKIKGDKNMSSGKKRVLRLTM